MKTGQSLWMMPTRSTPGTSAAVSTRTTPGTAGGGARVDADHVGTGVVGEAHRPVQHAGRAQVVDVGLVAEREVEALIAASARADAAERFERDRLALGEQFDRVEDLHVARATAQVRAEVAGRGVAVEVGALLLEQRRDPHEDPRGAEAALQRAGRRERGGQRGRARRRGNPRVS